VYDGMHKKREAELAQIGGRPARQAQPHQGRDPVRDAKSNIPPLRSNYSEATTARLRTTVLRLKCRMRQIMIPGGAIATPVEDREDLE